VSTEPLPSNELFRPSGVMSQYFNHTQPDAVVENYVCVFVITSVSDDEGRHIPETWDSHSVYRKPIASVDLLADVLSFNPGTFLTMG
jgi:hypothetical protein